MKKDIALRTTFDSQAELYQAIRPHYPEVLFNTLVKIARLKKDSNLLEIGPGTGQATEPLAKIGYKITAVELGAELANVARRELKKYKNVEILPGAFEEIELSPKSFDLIYAATAFHWIKPDIKFTKTHELLKPEGHLAIIGTNHVSDEAGDDFFFAAQPMYKKYKHGENYDEFFRLPQAAQLKADPVDENLFTPIFFKILVCVLSIKLRFLSASSL